MADAGAFTAAGVADPGPVDGDGHPLDLEDVIPASEIGEPMDDDAEGSDDDLDGLTDEEAFAAYGKGIQAAEFYIDSEVSPEREMLARYYDADVGVQPAEKGRSAVISPEVRGAVLSSMPAMMRKFAGTERFVEFVPNAGTPQEQADFQTDYIRHVMMNDNTGYVHIQSAIDDALRRRTGIFTWWWEEKEIVTRDVFSGLDENAFALLQMDTDDKASNDEGIEFDIIVTDKVPDETQDGGDLVPPVLSDQQPGDQELMAQAGAPQMEAFRYSGYVNKRIIRGRAKFRAVPPEEFIITPTSSADLDTYALIGTREMKTISEIVALGIEEWKIREALDRPQYGETGGGQSMSSLDQNPERVQRNDTAAQERIFDSNFADVDPSSERVKYCVVYILIDKDGDGIAERRKVVTVGDNYGVVYDEIYEDDMVPFGLICPYPEPHAPFGMSAADMALDGQEIKTELMRGTLDSLGESLSSRLAFWQGKVNIDDILNTQRGAAIRTGDVPGNVIQNLAPPFVGMNVLPIVQYLDQEMAKRSGQNPASPAGFDPDSTQSTAREAVGSIIDASQERNEYMARNMAETGFRRLVVGLRNLTLKHQDHRRYIRMNGQDATIDPRTWDADLDVRVTDAGRTTSTKHIANLQTILGMQMNAFQQLGPGNPMVKLSHIAYTSSELFRAMGYTDPYRFMGRVSDADDQKMLQAQAASAQKPTPEMLMYQANKEKLENDLKKALMAENTKLRIAGISDDQRRDAKEMDFSVAAAKILGDFGIKINEQQVRAAMEANSAATGLADDMHSQVNRQEDRQDAQAQAQRDTEAQQAQQGAAQ
jgi:hypothetical protein